MKNKFGTVCMIMGAALLMGALSLFLHNQHLAARAEQTSVDLLPQLLEKIEEHRPAAEETQATVQPVETPLDFPDPCVIEMTEVEIDGYGYIGCLAIPALNLELPVMGDWDYTRLNIAPCRYTGTTGGNDLVVMAHNFDKHFGRLRELSEGDEVVFTDMDGIVNRYRVVGVDVLAPTAVAEMTAGDFDLTLFTCTFGGQSRVTVYCDRARGG